MKDKRQLILNNVADPLDEFVITLDDLDMLLSSNERIVSYCGYEPSGPIHLGYFPTIMKAKEISKIGVVKILLADYHAYLNLKGPLELIRDLSKNYWIPVFKALEVNAEYVIGSEFQSTREYIEDIYTLSRRVSTKRAIKAVTMILRETQEISVGAAIYPIMQVVDIIHLGVNLAFGGTDQRKIHALLRDILTREVVEELHHGAMVPVCIHLPMIAGLKKGEKMSSSKPETHIAVHDKPESIKHKIKRAYCPPQNIDPAENPIISIIKYVIMPYADKFRIDRPEKYGGPIEFTHYADLASEYKAGKIHPLDLKNAVYEWIVDQFRPVHKLFEKDPDTLRPVYKLQKWNFERGYIPRHAWSMLEKAYLEWFK